MVKESMKEWEKAWDRWNEEHEREVKKARDIYQAGWDAAMEGMLKYTIARQGADPDNPQSGPWYHRDS